MKTKYCKTCETKKPVKDFSRNGPWRKEKCKPCAAKVSKEYAERRKKARAEMGKWF